MKQIMFYCPMDQGLWSAYIAMCDLDVRWIDSLNKCLPKYAAKQNDFYFWITQQLLASFQNTAKSICTESFFIK